MPAACKASNCRVSICCISVADLPLNCPLMACIQAPLNSRLGGVFCAITLTFNNMSAMRDIKRCFIFIWVLNQLEILSAKI